MTAFASAITSASTWLPRKAGRHRDDGDGRHRHQPDLPPVPAERAVMSGVVFTLDLEDHRSTLRRADRYPVTDALRRPGGVGVIGTVFVRATSSAATPPRRPGRSARSGHEIGPRCHPHTAPRRGGRAISRGHRRGR
ncbi:MAG: hypothetical protein R2695_05640 [Acidimicrobiales bacterium]